jgi:hypothetical protein
MRAQQAERWSRVEQALLDVFDFAVMPIIATVIFCEHHMSKARPNTNNSGAEGV